MFTIALLRIAVTIRVGLELECGCRRSILGQGFRRFCHFLAGQLLVLHFPESKMTSTTRRGPRVNIWEIIDILYCAIDF